MTFKPGDLVLTYAPYLIDGKIEPGPERNDVGFIIKLDESSYADFFNFGTINPYYHENYVKYAEVLLTSGEVIKFTLNCLKLISEETSFQTHQQDLLDQ